MRELSVKTPIFNHHSFPLSTITQKNNKMKIFFNIEYRTRWGEDLRVQLWRVDTQGKKHEMEELPLQTQDGNTWKGEMEMEAMQTVHAYDHERKDGFEYRKEGFEYRRGGFEYKYAMYRDGKLVWTEWEVAPHKVTFDGVTHQYMLSDQWRPIPEDLPLFSSAYTECVGVKSEDNTPIDTLFSSTLQLRVVEPRLRKGEYLAICGNTLQLGEWQHAKKMALVHLQEWAVNLDADLMFDEIEYKYVVVDAENNILQWEEGENRKLNCPKLDAKEMWIKTDERLKLNRDSWKVAGVVVPVFSLRSARSYGVGDFGDLKELIKWVVKTKMHAIQILPINDTMTTGTWQDSYPYNAISVFALHPLYCDIQALPQLNNRLMMEKFLIRQQKLNALKELDYEQVIALKMEYLHLLYAQEGMELMAQEGYQTFFQKNKDWLIPYATFSYLRDKYGTAEFSQWPKYNVFCKREIEELCNPTDESKKSTKSGKGGKNTRKKGKDEADADAYKQIAFYYFIQYLLDAQLQEVRNEARKNGVIIKGDIPIGISRNSVEAWSESHLFHLDGQAGAPRDNFSKNGQNWGFPTYNWNAMAKDGYRWWTRRFQKMAEYFDAYRIDHVLGFFRIWDIPMHSVHGLLGQFSPSLPMTIEEIESFGMRFNAESMTRPYITDQTLNNIFGYRAELVKAIYLRKRTDGKYDLKDEYASQRKIEAAFAGKTDEDHVTLRDGLYDLTSCVLFIPDRNHADMYHPRIAAQDDYVFESLLPHEREAFTRLHNEYYYHRHNKFWYDEAMKKLPTLTQSTRMLVCAEDLGMVPESVGWVMNDLKILSLEIQSMPKSPYVEFGRLWENPYRSVATISTHDMPPLRQWWDEDLERAQKFYNTALHKDGTAPHPAPGWLCEEIVSAHLFCPSALTLLSLQDWLSMDEELRLPNPAGERINIPANPRHYWRYRTHLTIEQLMGAERFNKLVKEMIENSGR